MHRAVVIAAALISSCLALAGCGEELTPEEQALKDARDVAMVEAANAVAPPVQPVTPDPILAPDMDQYDLSGLACSYAPGTSLSARVIAREVDAYVKIKGRMVRFAADAGSRELPGRTRSLYSGKEFALQLNMRADRTGTASDNPDSKDAVQEYEGTVVLRDRYGREVYEGSGLAQCSA